MESTLHCQHYLSKKKRFCCMKLLPGENYCGQHVGDKYITEEACYIERELSQFIKHSILAGKTVSTILSSLEDEERQQLLEKCKGDVRIVCPLDPSHTCYVRLLKKHLKKCNAAKHQFPDYFKKDINGAVNIVMGPSLRQLTDQEVKSLIDKIKNIYEEPATTVPDISGYNSMKDGLPTLAGRQFFNKMDQIFSLLSIMRKNVLLELDTCFVEMGAGRGELSFRLCESLGSTEDVSFVLVDRASVRHKADNRLKDASNIDMSRTKIDIRNLDLKSHPKVAAKRRLVVYSKHLCGNATDLCLRSSESCTEQLQGMVIALCCHHRCDWNDYVGKEYFLKWGFEEEDFTAICGLTSWATCGLSKAKTSQQVGECEDNDLKLKEHFTVAEREKIGHMAKTILDQGRVEYFRQKGYQAKLLFYVDREVTPENVAILIKKSNIVI